MPQYVAPVDADDIVLLGYVNRQPGLWYVLSSFTPGPRGVFGSYRSWRRARFFADSIGPLAVVYFCNGSQWFQAIP